MKTSYKTENGARVFECNQNGQPDLIYQVTIHGERGTVTKNIIAHELAGVPYVAARIWNENTGEHISPAAVSSIEFIGGMDW